MSVSINKRRKLSVGISGHTILRNQNKNKNIENYRKLQRKLNYDSVISSYVKKKEKATSSKIFVQRKNIPKCRLLK